MKRNKKMQFSKLIVLIVNITFIIVLYYCLTRDFSTILDTSMLLGAITTTGAIALTVDVWYMKKSQAEHVSGISADVYEDIMNIRLQYNEGMMKLKLKYNLNDYDIKDIEEESPLDQISDDMLNRTEQKLNKQMDDATSTIEVQAIH